MLRVSVRYTDDRDRDISIIDSIDPAVVTYAANKVIRWYEQSADLLSDPVLAELALGEAERARRALAKFGVKLAAGASSGKN
jgi:hypothetical protein